jgi:hypothetical protein
MALSITHSYVSAVADAGDPSIVQPSDWNDVHDISGLAAGIEDFLATPSSANLKTAVTDETGSGALVFANTPTLVTPILGTPTSGTLTNCTGLPSIVAANEATDTTCFLTFFTAATGELGPKTNTNMTFNSNTGVATFASAVLTTADINGGTLDGATIGGSSAGAITGTTITANTGFMPDADDGSYLGQSGTGFADLFLASGGVINWNAGNATLTHSASLLTSNVAMSLGTSNAFTCGTIELGAASDTTLSRSAAGVVAVEGTVLIKGGTHTIWVPAGAMITATTSGAATGSLEAATNDQNYKVFDFDASADEHVHFQVAMPKGWDEGTVTYQVWWSSTATDTDGVAWALQGVALSDNEAIDASWGTAVVVTDDAQSAAGEVYVTSASAAVTIAGTPAEGDVVFFRLFRDVSDANDDMTEDARLIGIKLFYTVAAANDA